MEEVEEEKTVMWADEADKDSMKTRHGLAPETGV